MTTLPRVFLMPQRDRRVMRGYPWAFSNEIRMDAATKGLPPGTVASLHRVDGKPLGVGTFNPHALIAFRLFDRYPETRIDEDFFVRRLDRALALRRKLYAKPFYRLIHGEADGLPGLIADRFDDVVVMQHNTAGIDALAPALMRALDATLRPKTVVLRNDAPSRAWEGLRQATEVVKGEIGGAIAVEEGDLRFFADVRSGQKTGWYFDQRENRQYVASLAGGADVLDVFCHSGGFAVSAAARGARRVVAVDSSETALDLAGRAAEANRVEAVCEFRRSDAFAELERLAAEGRRFSIVVADPPAFAKSRKDLALGLKGYRKLARLCAPVVEPGGFLFIASCSHIVEADAFATEVGRGLDRAGRSARVIRASGAGPDHPVPLHFPESAYLKCLLLHLDEGSGGEAETPSVEETATPDNG